MKSIVKVPNLGGSVSLVALLEWLVAPGQEVRAQEPIAVLETEKTQVEVPCPLSGTVVELLAVLGDELSIGDPLLSVDGHPVS